jgi:hypothetical protein
MKNSPPSDQSDFSAPSGAGEILLYQSADGKTRLDCRFEAGTIWLTQAQIAELFQTTSQNITIHIRAIYDENEQQEAATCKEYLQVQQEKAQQLNINFKKIFCVSFVLFRG